MRVVHWQEIAALEVETAGDFTMKMELRSRAVDKLYRRRDRIEMPDFQRQEVWPESKKKALMDTMLRGWHLPKLYFRKLDESTFECVDGQQRLTAIWEFYDDALALAPETARRVGGSYYKDLPTQVQDDLDDFELDIEEIQDADDEELEDLFQRLQLGTPLNTPERLNAIGGGMRDFVKGVSKNAFFSGAVGVKDTRFAHFDIAAKFVLVEARGVQPQMRFSQLETFFKENKSFSKGSQVGKQVEAALKYLQAAFPTRCDWLRNRANVLSVCMLGSHVVRHKLHNGTSTKFGRFVSDFFRKLAAEVERGAASKERELLEYQQAISYGSAAGDSINKRLTILVKRLATFDPAFAALLSTKPGAEDNVSATADAVRQLIHSVNDRHAALNGEDLFKMTNASAAALSTLATPVKTAEQYGNLIDALYKLIYEGSGACKRLPVPAPEFAMEIKHLRTALRHDVDHGDAPDAAKKRKRGAEVFSKFSGKRTPGECGADELLATQLRMLSAAQEMLEKL
jgi:hypothetical protein